MVQLLGAAEVGDGLRAAAAVVVDGELSVREARALAVEAEGALLHAVPKPSAALVHAEHRARGTRTTDWRTTSA